jgi:hypothetical protein
MMMVDNYVGELFLYTLKRGGNPVSSSFQPLGLGKALGS